jgi:hypothetical protein
MNIIRLKIAVLVTTSVFLNSAASSLPLQQTIEQNLGRILNFVGESRDRVTLDASEEGGRRVFNARSPKFDARFDDKGRIRRLFGPSDEFRLLTRDNPPETWTVRTRASIVSAGRAIMDRLGFPKNAPVVNVSLPKAHEEMTSAWVEFSLWPEPYPLRTNSHSVAIQMDMQGNLHFLSAFYEKAYIASSERRVDEQTAVRAAVEGWALMRYPSAKPRKAFLGYGADLDFPKFEKHPPVGPRHAVRLCWVVPFGDDEEAPELWVDAGTGRVIGGNALPWSYPRKGPRRAPKRR